MRFVCFSLSLVVLGALADQSVVVEADNSEILYQPAVGITNTSFPTWKVVPSSQDTCDTPQKMTEREGDYATFSFTGTGLTLIGTTGIKRGVIEITLDGESTMRDSTASTNNCDQVIFEKKGLAFQQHTFVARLISHQISFVDGKEGGALSIQRIRYTVPSGLSSGKIAAIVGSVVGVLGTIGVGLAVWYFFRRRSIKVKRRLKHNFFDADDPVSFSQPTPGQMVMSNDTGSAATGLVPTPFTYYLDPASQVQVNPRPPQSTYYGTNRDSYISNHPVMLPLLQLSDPSIGSSSGVKRTDTEFRDDSRTPSADSREPTERTSGTYVLANPDRQSHAGTQVSRFDMPGPSRGGSGYEEDALVERVAARLADMMGVRVGAPLTAADVVAPPIYEGRAEEEVANFQRRVEKRVEDIRQERLSAEVRETPAAELPYMLGRVSFGEFGLSGRPSVDVVPTFQGGRLQTISSPSEISLNSTNAPPPAYRPQQQHQQVPHEAQPVSEVPRHRLHERPLPQRPIPQSPRQMSSQPPPGAGLPSPPGPYQYPPPGAPPPRSEAEESVPNSEERTRPQVPLRSNRI